MMYMKKHFLQPVILLLALWGVVGLLTYETPCGMHDGVWGSCHWAGQTLLWLYAGMTALSLIGLFIRKPGLQAALLLLTAVLALCSVLVPGTLMKLCVSTAMRCNRIMKPFALVRGIVLTLLALAAGVVRVNRTRKGRAA